MYSKFRNKLEDVMARLEFSSTFLFNFFGFHLKSKKKRMDSRIISLVVLTFLLTVCNAENITDDPHEDPQIDCGEGIMIPGLYFTLHLLWRLFKKPRPFYKMKKTVFKTVYFLNNCHINVMGGNWPQFGDRTLVSRLVSAWAGGSSTS